MFDGLGELLKGMFILLCISVPLGLWKMVDIIIWLCHFFVTHWK